MSFLRGGMNARSLHRELEPGWNHRKEKAVTKKERAMLLKAINYFMDDDPNKWTDGMDIIYCLAHGMKWTDACSLDARPISVQELIRKIRRSS